MPFSSPFSDLAFARGAVMRSYEGVVLAESFTDPRAEAMETAGPVAMNVRSAPPMRYDAAIRDITGPVPALEGVTFDRRVAFLGRGHGLLVSFGLGHDAVGKLSGNLFVVGELRVMGRAPLGEGAQVGRVLVELGLGHVRADDVVAALAPHAEDLPAFG